VHRTMPKQQYISIRQLGEKLGLDPSNARKYVLKLGYKPVMRRTPESRGQKALTVTLKEADAIVKRRLEEGFLRSGKPVETEFGFFYVIQLVPELDPRRIKLGFAVNVSERLSEHRTASPTAKIKAKWPCRRSWERTVIDCLVASSCKLISHEVYECSDLEGLIKKGNTFFEVLPSPDFKPALAKTSPLLKRD